MDREGTVLLYAVICSRKLTKLFALGNGKEMLPVQVSPLVSSYLQKCFFSRENVFVPLLFLLRTEFAFSLISHIFKQNERRKQNVQMLKC